MKYYTVAEATKPELLSSLRAASKLASLKHLMLLFLHFTKKLYGFYARLLHNISQQSKILICYTISYSLHSTDLGKLSPTNLTPTSERKRPLAKLPDGPTEMGPSPVILLALEGEKEILPLQSEPFTNSVASFYEYNIIEFALNI